MNKIALFLFDGFSDWEISFVTPELQKSEDVDLFFFSKDGAPVMSAGGLSINVSHSLAEVNAENIDMLILPGGTAWEKGENEMIVPLTKSMVDQRKMVAAICAATIYLGHLGLLDNVNHTSNDLNYLKAVAPEYIGDAYYQHSLAATGGSIITANGIAPIEFAREIFEAIALYPAEAIEKWFQLFKNGIWSE